MALRPMPQNCDRARAWVSLRLDDEISELESALLDAHLKRCAACQEFEDSVRGAVLMLRAQPLEQVEHPITVAGLRRRHFRAGVVAKVAAVAVAAVGVTAVLGTQAAKTPRSHTTPLRVPAAVVTSDDKDFEQLRALRVMQLGGRPPVGSGVGAFGAVTNRLHDPAS
jgi:predicted anti-sigma-YlaC factor YlaD